MAALNNNPYFYNPYYPGYPQTMNYQQNQQIQPVQQNTSNGLLYCHGLEGAYATPMPVGATQIIIWDDTENRFYVKGYDNMGKPKILADNDFQPHVEKKVEKAENLDDSGYVTKEYLDMALSQLKIGEQGRIVRSDEHDA